MFNPEVNRAIESVIYDEGLAADWIRISESMGFPYGECLVMQSTCKVAYESDFYSQSDLLVIAAMVSFKGHLNGVVNQSLINTILAWNN